MDASNPLLRQNSAERSQTLQKACLTVELLGLRSNLGVINLAVFRNAAGFPNDAASAVQAGQFPISTVPLNLVFNDLPFGLYAITAHHDENMDGELNTNLLGIPTEGIGFSGNPKIWRGVPAFAKAQFDLQHPTTTISIQMKYLL
ncbi:MAG: DUF2141 domain-containing protein [Oculatellaceae cyanobacterium Prado106]|jgi:uncharacterized protein (DUF2141 family)|nr:DUF2141 domain-containing protein [Oculatellaceae cyanobacterium Prado106]